jgi:hypothetical protein
MVYLIRNAVLRSREFYADVRASIWAADAELLSSIIETYPQHHSLFQTLRSVHPDPVERLKVLAEPHRLLLSLRGWEFLGIGIIISSVFFNAFFPILIPAMDILSNVLSPTAFALLSSNLLSFGLALIFIPMAVGVIGISIWRAMFAAMMRNEKLHGIGRLGIGLGFGLLIGKQLSFFFYDQKTTPGTLSGVSLIALETVWGILLIISMFLFVHWVVEGSSTWLEAIVAFGSPRRFYVWGQAMIALLLTLWLVHLFNFYILLSEGDLFTTASQIAGVNIPENLLFLFLVFSILASIIISPLTLFGLITLWLFPLAVRVWQKGASIISRPDWAYLEPQSATRVPAQQNPLQLSLALRIGLIGGLAVLGISTALLIIWSFIPLAELRVRYQDLAFAMFAIATMILSVIIQMGVAGIAGFLAKHLGWAHGLFSAFVACLIVATGIIVFLSLSDMGISLESGWVTFIIIYYAALPFVIPAALGMSALSQRARIKRSALQTEK